MEWRCCDFYREYLKNLPEVELQEVRERIEEITQTVDEMGNLILPTWTIFYHPESYPTSLNLILPPWTLSYQSELYLIILPEFYPTNLNLILLSYLHLILPHLTLSYHPTWIISYHHVTFPTNMNIHFDQILYLCQFNSDLYEMLNWSSCATNQ